MDLLSNYHDLPSSLFEKRIYLSCNLPWHVVIVRLSVEGVTDAENPYPVVVVKHEGLSSVDASSENPSKWCCAEETDPCPCPPR